jgi:hypothetical protein
VKVGPLPGHMLIASGSKAGRARWSCSAVQPAIRYADKGKTDSWSKARLFRSFAGRGQEG